MQISCSYGTIEKLTNTHWYTHTYTHRERPTLTLTLTAANCIWSPKWQLHDGRDPNESKASRTQWGSPQKGLFHTHTNTQISTVCVWVRILSRKTCVKHNYLLCESRRRGKGAAELKQAHTPVAFGHTSWKEAALDEGQDRGEEGSAVWLGVFVL